MARLYFFTTKWLSINSSRQLSWPVLLVLWWFFLDLTPLQAQYTIHTNGIYNPVFNNPVDVTLQPDELSAPLNIGFNFSFFGNSYSQFSISSNGFISFQVPGESGTQPQTIPDPTDPNDLIALGWSAFLPDYIEISYETIGTAPYRSLHVNIFMEDYVEPLPCSSGFLLIGQIILYETTNIIELHTDFWDGGDCNKPATQGIENEDGTIAFFTPGRNNVLWTTSSSFVKFVPDDYTDLAVFAMDPVLCEGLRDIRILVQNIGITTVDTFYTDWTWDGVPQDAVNIYTSLPPNSATEVVLGQKTLVSGSNYMLKAWTFEPENGPDHFTLNDTITGTVKGGLAGTFTIGGSSPDYPTISAAIADLVTSGACDTVVFNIRNGTYTEELDIPYFPIVSGAVVIFQSETNNPNHVTITRNYTSGSTNRMIEINNASHIHFKDLTLRVTGTVCSSVVYVNSYCADVHFTGCTIIGPTCNSTTTSGAVVALFNGQKDDIQFENNVIRKGSYGVYVSPGSSSFANNLVLENNSIDSAYRYGAFLNRIQGLSVIGNSIFSPATNANGIETNTTYGPTRLERNNIYLPQGSYGLRVYRHNYNAPPSTDTMFILNNMINLAGSVSGSRVLSLEQNTKVNVWHNTFHTTSTNTASYSLYSISNTQTDLRNNVITNFGAGRVAWMTTLTSDHNVFYNTTPPLISNGSNYNLLEDWVQASGQDQNSLQIDPEFVSSTDLHVGHGALNNAGDDLTPPVSEDFDEENRIVATPDIGADEFGFLNDDMLTADLLFSNQLVTGENEIRAVVYNIGLNPVNTYALAWKINNTVYTPVMVSTPIPVGGGDTIVLGTVDFDPNVSYTIRVNTHLPNGNPDSDTSNDTLIVGPVYAMLNGTYTVGGVSPDFPTLSGAFVALASGGVLDSVAFAVRDGIYNDPLDLTTNANYACTTPISVYGESLDASEVIFNNNSLVKPVIRLNGVHGIHFSHMTFELTASAFHNVVIIENGASCNSFTSCFFIGRISTQTSAAYATVLCNSTQGVDNDFFGNTFSLGAFGLNTNGPNLSTGSLVDIIGNTFINNYVQGLSVTNSKYVNVIWNEATITSAQTSGYTGIFLNNCKSMVLSHNSVYNPFGGGTAIGFSECDGTTVDTTRVYNNYVYSGTSNNLQSIFGGSYSDYTHIANNTSRSHLGRAAGFSWCANFRLDNNIFECISTGVTLELLNMQGSNIVSNNNCFYGPNASIGEYNNVVYQTMVQWQALGFDGNSFQADPYFEGVTHTVHSIYLDKQGSPYHFIDNDLDGDPRHPNYPDIGADEFNPSANDAGMLGILNPKMPFPAGVNPVYVRFFNNGVDTLTSLQFDWEVNGVPQEPMVWTGILPKTEVYDSLQIGTFDFASYSFYDIKIWSSQPNNTVDPFHGNDTLKLLDLIPGLSGVYTIGGEDPDFETITEAVNAINTGGAAAPVTFNIRNGSYSEPILLNDFAGSDCNRPVIFQSESGDSSLVTITNLGINAHTIVLNGADGIHFKNMTLKSVNTSFRHVVLFSGGAHCNHFEGNTFKGFVSTATANTSAVIRSTVGLDTANVIINNRIFDGSYSIHLTGNNGGNANTIISGNHLEPFYRGIYNSAVQGTTVSHNVILADNSNAGVGVEYNSSHNLKEISYNHITVPLGQYGIALDNCDNTTTNRGRIFNNFISVGGTGIARGIYLNGCAFQDIIHNSILVYSTNATLANTTPLYINSSPDVRIINNASRNAGPGYAIYANGNTTFQSDHNSFHTAGTTFGLWNAAPVETTFANWQTASGQDVNSLNVNPVFMSNTDLHTFLALLNGEGKENTGIWEDIDGEPRDTIPDIGADEFDPLPSNDAGIFMYVGPSSPFASGVRNVQLVIKNFGGNVLNNVDLHWTVNGTEQTTIEWSGSLASSACVTVTVGSYNFQQLTQYIVDAWTEMPNNVEDSNPDNDLFTTAPFYASLAGTYTIGGFAPDFNLVSDLETILNSAGIVNNVTFNFRPGTYTEPIVISEFPRISYAHGVVFQSEDGDSTEVILTQNVNNTVLIDLDDAHRITFRKLTLLNLKGHAIQIRNGSSLINIENNHLEGLQTLSSSRSLIYSSTTTEDSISILNNVFKHGYYGIYLYGGEYEKRHIIQNNTFLGNYSYAVYLREFDGLTLSRNTIQADLTGNLDIYMYNGTGAHTITRNKVISDNSNLAVYLGLLTNTSPNTTLFANNYVYKAGTVSSDVVQIENSSKLNIDFNTVYNAVTNTGSAALYTSNLTTCNVRNNIMFSASGPAYQNSGTMPAIHNYNAIYSLGPIEAIQNSTTYTSLPAYVTGTSSNANSKAVDPLFYSGVGPEIAQFLLNGAGITVSGITTDFYGSTRTSPPDIGADEFAPVMHDVKVSHVSSPVDGCGLENDEQVSLVLVNFGSSTASGFDVMMTLEGQTTTENIGALQVPPGDSVVYTFNQTIDVSDFETYNLSFEIDYNNDINPGNDSIGHTFVNHPPIYQPAGNLIPVNGTTGLENQVSLSWSPVTDAAKYNLYVWPMTSSKPVTPTHAGLTTINKLMTGLLYGTTYKWQIHALNLCDDELASDTSTFSVRSLPDLVVQSMIIPATAFSEQTIGIEWIVKNQGVGTTFPGTWYDNIYLSPDPTYNSFDPLLAAVPNLSSLNPNQSYTHNANVVLPQGTNGLYYIIIKSDHYSAVKETSDVNNTSYSSTQMNVTLSPPPDLLVTDITTPLITFSGSTINMTFTVSNLGSGVTSETIWKDEITLLPAPGNNNGTTSSLGLRTHVGVLQPDSSYTVSLSVAIPANIFGNYQIRVDADNRFEVFEFASEGNNLLLSDIIQVVLTPPADLVPDSLNTPDTMSLYGTYPVNFQIKNQGGSAPTITYTDRYYLSQSPVYNTNFLTHLGYVYHNPGLMPGQYEEKSVNVKLTGNYSGIYYIYVVTDYSNRINEYAFENNNILRSDPIMIIRPDMKPDSLIHPVMVMSGSTMSLRTEVINPGLGVFYGSYSNRYYLSADNTLSTMTDILLSTRSVNNIALTPEDTVSNTFNIQMPSDQFGSKYLLVVADANQVVFESNELNNVLASPITIFEAPHPDLNVSNINAPNTIVAGVTFDLSYTLRNQGDVPLTVNTTDSIFISFSPSWNRATAIPLGTRQTSLLDTGQTITYTVPLETTYNQNPNEYYIYIISDATQKAYEGSGEANNIGRSDLIVLETYPDIDLSLIALSGLPDTLTSGQPYNVQYEVSNLTDFPTYFSGWTDRYYFSADSIFNAGSDMLLGSVAYSGGSIEQNEPALISMQWRVPHGITGDYYAFIETDSEDKNEDINRLNNANTIRIAGDAKRLHVKLALYPDLQPTSFNCPVEVVSGQYFTINTSVTNQGLGSARARTDKIFVSTNNTIENGDLTLASLSKAVLGSQLTQSDNLSVFVPANYSGNYFIIYSVDHGNLVYEHLQENDNIILTSIIATPPPPADLIITDVLVPDSVLAGQTASITWNTENTGTNPASGIFREIVYLSADTSWNLTDEVIGIWDGSVSLGPGAVSTKTVAFPYNNVTNADYHTIIRTDARNNIPESHEDNNEGFSYDLTNVDIEELFINQNEHAILVEGVNRYYKVLIEADVAGRNVLVSLTGDSLVGVNQMFVKYEAVPTPADHDFAYTAPFYPHQRIIIRGAEPGYYYIMINGFKSGDSTPQDVEILARVIPMELLDISPRRGGNKGFTTIEAIGSELDSIVVVKLVRNDTTQSYFEIIADTFFMTDEGTRIIARFNLEGQPLAHYDFLCQRESIWMTKLERVFEVIEGSGPDLQVHWDFNPKSFNPRFTTIFQIKIDVENRGDTDAMERYIRVGAPEYNNPMYYSLQDYYNGIVHPQLVLASEDQGGFPGILRPGGRRTFYVFGRVGGTQGFSISYDK